MKGNRDHNEKPLDISLDQAPSILSVCLLQHRVVAQHHPPSVIEGPVHLSVDQNLLYFILHVDILSRLALL